jgi:hypothetical protein
LFHGTEADLAVGDLKPNRSFRSGLDEVGLDEALARIRR